MEVENSYVLNVNENAAHYLYRSAQWSKFFAILGFISAGLMIFGTFALMGMSSLIPGMRQGMAPQGQGLGPAAFLSSTVFILGGIFYFAMAIVNIVIAIKLYRFADKAIAALKTNDDEMLELSFKNMNSFLQILGILTIVVISIYVITLVVMMLAGFGAAMMGR
ncbi:DUF5362 family protein [Saccharicrinis sp. FJH54]|uniref:DUF5362 family protein n=1 Tax=Saccharicrinis sp. FJH54 TaxID=3344665 RepID=UPI0035D48ACE